MFLAPATSRAIDTRLQHQPNPPANPFRSIAIDPECAQQSEKLALRHIPHAPVALLTCKSSTTALYTNAYWSSVCTMPMRCRRSSCTKFGTFSAASTSARSGPQPSRQEGQASRRCSRMSIAQKVPVRPMPCRIAKRGGETRISRRCGLNQACCLGHVSHTQGLIMLPLLLLLNAPECASHRCWLTANPMSPSQSCHCRSATAPLGCAAKTPSHA